jgi:hypothetical protein
MRFMKETAIVYDADGVIVRTIVPVLNEFNRALGTGYTENEFRGWNWIYKKTMEKTGSEELARKLDGLWTDNDVLRKAPAYPGAILTINMLRMLGVDQRIATTRPPINQAVTIDWFYGKLPWMVNEDRINMRSDESVTGDEFKVKKLEEFRPDLYVDDSGTTMKYVIGSLNGNLKITKKLMNRAWNNNFNELNDYRVNGWMGIWATAMRIWMANHLEY